MGRQLAILICILGFSQVFGFNCKPFEEDSKDHTGEVCYVEKCTKKIINQVEKELNAAFHYLFMAAHFDQEDVHRPGMAKFLYESASEEREHAKMMLDYLNFRGIPFEKTYKLAQSGIDVPDNLDYKMALVKALNMEIEVTNFIYKIVKDCETDYHAADEFTDPILKEQHSGVRKLQGFIKTFEDMVRGSHDTDEVALAEFLFDRKMI